MGQIKGGSALHPDTQTGILFPLALDIRECSVTSLCSLSSLPLLSLLWYLQVLGNTQCQMTDALVMLALPAVSLCFDSECDHFNVLCFTAIRTVEVITHECVLGLLLVHYHFYL